MKELTPWQIEEQLDRRIKDVQLCLCADQCPSCMQDGFPRAMRSIAHDHLRCDGCQFDRWLVGETK